MKKSNADSKFEIPLDPEREKGNEGGTTRNAIQIRYRAQREREPDLLCDRVAKWPQPTALRQFKAKGGSGRIRNGGKGGEGREGKGTNK